MSIEEFIEKNNFTSQDFKVCKSEGSGIPFTEEEVDRLVAKFSQSKKQKIMQNSHKGKPIMENH